jgi:enterochelin esterase-like enzyme
MSAGYHRNAFARFFFARFTILILIACTSATAQSVQDFVTRLSVLPEAQRQAVVDSFFTVSRTYPVADNDTTVFFVYQGGVAGATVPGDANNWDPSAFPMTRVTGTNFWYSKKIFELDARLDYKFVVNGGTWILDPKNPLTVTGGMGQNSELRMPKYVSAPEILYYPTIPHGTLHDTTYTSAALGNSRAVRVYTPPGYESSRDSFPVILFHDGLEYVTLAQTDNIIDYLIWKGRIPPIVAVFVPPVNRTPEYVSTQIDQFSAFIVNELMPSIDARYRTRRDPASRAVLGASNGGNISLWLGYNYPGAFGNVGAQSSYILPSLSDGFRNSAKLKLKLYLDLGTYDIPLLIPMVRGFVPILQSKGYSLRYREVHEGHSWGNWRTHVAEALEFFFGNPSTGMLESPALPEDTILRQNFPNPFNPTTMISIVLPRSVHVALRVYDVIGREVATVITGGLGEGRHQYASMRRHWPAESTSTASQQIRVCRRGA